MTKEILEESKKNRIKIQDISNQENLVDHNDRNNNLWEYEIQQQELFLENYPQNFMQTTDQSIIKNQVDQLAENNYLKTPMNYCQF